MKNEKGRHINHEYKIIHSIYKKKTNKTEETDFKLYLGIPQRSTLKLYKPNKDQGVEKWVGRAHHLY